MTSQLILMNGFGVALASDSAVTVGGKRTYDTAEKIIPLPAPHRLAVLHSGSVNIHGMPYSVLINEWAASLGTTRLRSVALYRQNFLSWLNDNRDWVSTKRSDEDFIDQLEDLYREIWDGITKVDDAQDVSSEAEQACLDEFIKWTDIISGWSSLAPDEDDWASEAYARMRNRIDEVRGKWFDDIPMSAAIEQQIATVTRLYLARGHLHRRSELAFVGFGEKQLLPSYAAVEVNVFVHDYLLHRMTAEQISPDLESGSFFAICPIGQRDAIDRFLLGVDYGTVDVATRAALEVFLNKSNESGQVEGASDDESKTDAETQLGNNVYREIKTAFQSWSYENFKQPLFGAIAALPLASLAAAAQSLIGIQSLSQTITGEMGTVGGPIDVAVISRENGFQWINHKSISL